MNHDVSILVVEDDEVDIRNIRRAFGRNGIRNPVHFVEDGESALAFLRHEAPFEDPSDAPRPALILLDLNLPKMNGLEFLQTYKEDPSLRDIPAVILTTSDEPTDRRRSYEYGISGYIVKPVSFESFTEAMRRFELYWSICEVPDP